MILKVILIVLVIIVAVLAILYFYASKMQTKQLEQQKLIKANTQTAKILVIDKKSMRIKDAPLPQAVVGQQNAAVKMMKVNVVRAKIGPKIYNLIAEKRIADQLPMKAECTVKISGIYISEVLKGGVLTEKERALRKKEREKAAKKRS